jgi:hypothetical protein
VDLKLFTAVQNFLLFFTFHRSFAILLWWFCFFSFLNALYLAFRSVYSFTLSRFTFAFDENGCDNLVRRDYVMFDKGIGAVLSNEREILWIDELSL